jgi:hypothetical protein
MEPLSKRAKILRVCMFALGLALLVLSASEGMSAGAGVRAPEIDGGLITTGLGVLAAGVLIVRARMQSK